ncbi:MAG: DNA mismatch repair endonuclease MutL [Bacteroidetes bacterium]|nr:MAG: DNA mismatch repair endonuclease MutL [Bacteroidota bacterium]
MSDIIRLLPDSVANQIAAGEVIQRPSSAVKELLENAVDAGSSHIELFIKDSGRTLIQIVDNGSGMSPTDARLCFSRHATSKIQNADDLFSIRTKGFRGEALASIASIAQVELKTKRHDDELGTCIQIEGAEITGQTSVATSPGTSISIRNLFFNVPARRNFLKSNNVEARHIIEEFERVALAHPEVAMSLHQNGIEIFQLPLANHRQRIVSVYGSHYNERLVPVTEETSLLSISGFIGKPAFSKKSRGEQFFFVNRRFIRDGYLNHAVTNAFEELLPRDSYPSYWLFIDIDPSRIDVNIHPTKTEIKFEDERSVYAIVRAAVKRSLGQYSIAPALDFEKENSFELPHSMRSQTPAQPTVTVNTNYNPFRSDFNKTIANAGWEKLYTSIQSADISQQNVKPVIQVAPEFELKTSVEKIPEEHGTFFQLNNEFIICTISGGLLCVDQQAAHQRILFEKYINRLQTDSSYSQQDLFPETLDFSASDVALLQELVDEIRSLGFDIREFGGNSFVLHGSPPEVLKGTEKSTLESILDKYKNGESPSLKNKREILAASMAKSVSIKSGQELSTAQMKSLLDDLLACDKPGHGIHGKPCMTLLKTEEIRDRFL